MDKYVIIGEQSGASYQEKLFCKTPSGVKSWFHTEEHRNRFIKRYHKKLEVVTVEEYEKIKEDNIDRNRELKSRIEKS